MRTLLCSALAFAVCIGAGFAADDKPKDQKKPDTKKVDEKKPEKPKGKKHTVAGTVKKFDAATGTLTISTKLKKETVDKEVKLADTLKFTIWEGESKKEATGKDGYKELKDGAKVAIVTDVEGKPMSVTVGTPPKRKPK